MNALFIAIPRLLVAAVLLFSALCVVALMLSSLAFYDNFAFRAVFSLDLSILTPPVLQSLVRTAMVALIASIVAFAFVELALTDGPNPIKVIGLLVLYSMDPVIRTRSLHSAELHVAGLLPESIVSAMGNAWSGVLVPALALAISYAPLYAGLRVWDIMGRTVSGYRHRPRLLYTVLQPAFRRAPLALSLLFLFCFFDSWIAPVASGRRFDYWGSIALRHAQIRDIDGALTLSLLGFLVVVLFTVLLFGARALWDRIFQLWRPYPTPLARRRKHRGIIWWGVLCVGLWPIFWLLTVDTSSGGIEAFSVTLILAETVWLSAIVLGMTFIGSALALGLFYFSSNLVRRVLGTSCWILVLTPELVFVIGSTYIGGSEVVRPGLLWAAVLFSAFTVSLTFLAVLQFLDASGAQHVPLLSSVASFAVFAHVRVLLLGYRRELAVAGLLVFWLTWENVILLRVALGPAYTTVAISLFDNAARSIDLPEVQLALWSFWVRAVVFGCCAYVLARGRRIRDA